MKLLLLMYNSIVKDLVLIGGGHSHIIVLKMLGMHPIPGVRLTLITDSSDTPYSGMLPGHIAGFYNYDECHVNLRLLANFAQTQLYIDNVVGLDLAHNQILCSNRPPVSFDVLSIDIGSTPDNINTSGASEYAIPAKPVSKLLTRWEEITKRAADNPQQQIKIAIVGGGIGGVELALAMSTKLSRIVCKESLDVHLFQRNSCILPHNNQFVRSHIRRILYKHQIQVYLGENINQIESKKNNIFKLQSESGLTGEYTHIFWVTQPSAAPWLQTSPLKTDTQGFILVDDTLQSLSHPYIFAAGDIATMVNYPRSKAGVFAVRQGKPLFTNLRRYLQGKSLQSYIPQKKYLSLIGTGDGRAIATRDVFTLPPNTLIWYCKDWIDRRFMKKFSDLPQMRSTQTKTPLINHKSISRLSFTPFYSTQNQSLKPDDIMPCAGCGSKVGSTVMTKVLQRIQTEQINLNHQQNIIIGLETADDGSVIKVTGNKFLVQTIDYFRALVNDPYLFGQIATNHCLSDIFAMGAVPHSVLAIANIPYGINSKVEETFYQLLSGSVKVLRETNTSLIGGHTAESYELGFGLSCNGFADTDKLLRKGGMKVGDVVILTKALGTGTLFAADMRHQAKSRWIDKAITSMLISNGRAAECLLQNNVNACTDVTGFGLLGHLLEMVSASGIGVDLELEKIPILPGARETIAQGILSTLHPENVKSSHYIVNRDSLFSYPYYPIIFDPQTSGGLLASVPFEHANDCINQLQSIGYKDSSVVAYVIPSIRSEGFINISCSSGY